MTPEECLVIYGEAWFERDAARRVDILRRCCTEDIVFMDPRLGRLHGLDAVSDMIGQNIGSMSASAPDDAPSTSVADRRGRSGGGVSVWRGRHHALCRRTPEKFAPPRVASC